MEGNKLVYICGFCKIRKMCSQHVLMHVQTWLTCHPSQSLPPLASLSLVSHCAQGIIEWAHGHGPCFHVTTSRSWLRNTNTIRCQGKRFKNSMRYMETLHPDACPVNIMFCRCNCNIFYLANNTIQQCVISNYNFHDVLSY